jgi:dihydrofolate synthase/folylpolyglutamate synthase
MTYSEALDELYNRLPMFSRIGAAAYKKDIGNTLAICDALRNPQNTFKSIHIAGTNGKGSCSHMLAAVMQQAGYKTGLYTSPHITDFGERIRINGKKIDQDFVIRFVEDTRALAELIKPSFFELTVGMAFAYFAEHAVDIAIIETGLGGRLDSTNIITPILSIITNIGYDHMNLLGSTLPEIAFEKAGIIKNETPAVIGATLPETKQVFEEKAATCKAPIFFAPDHYHATHSALIGGHQHITGKDLKRNTLFTVETDLLGNYQQENIQTVLTAIDTLVDIGFSIPNPSVEEGLAKVRAQTGIRGRWDVLQQAPTVIADVGHNEDGIRTIIHQLTERHQNGQWHFVIGFVNDKEIDKILALFPKNATYYFTQAQIERALPAAILQKKAIEKKLTGHSFDHVNQALEKALQTANKQDTIVICGSFFLLAELDAYQDFSK